MGANGFLINVSRGAVADQAALISALQAGTIAGAGLDVFEDEPEVPQAIIALDNVVLTPHMASGTQDTRRAMEAVLLKTSDPSSRWAIWSRLPSDAACRPLQRRGHRPCWLSHMRYVLAFSLLLPATAHAATLLDAFYDSDTDEIIVEIAYRGTEDNHRYVVEWGECRREESPPGVAGRVIDLRGDDVAETDFRVREAFTAAALPCRPAQVTLWLGLRSNASVFVPGP